MLIAAFFVIALLYACVGQAGGAGYIAVLGLAGFDAATIKSTSLLLTLLLAAITSIRLRGLAKVRDWYPFVILGVPMSAIGGALHLEGRVYALVVGALLIGAAAQMAWSAKKPPNRDPLPTPPFLPALVSGGVIGIVSGVIGIGGGIFLAPLMLFAHWAGTRQIMAASALFNLCISLAGFVGVAASLPVFPPALPLWAGTVAAGGLIGVWLGAKQLPDTALRYILAVILLASGIKLLT